MGSLADGFKVQKNVVAAMLLREFAGRFSRENIGFLWIIGEPLMLATVITTMHLLQPAHMAYGVDPAAFAIIGYTIFIIFRGVVTRSESLVDVNASLFFHRPVKTLDLVLARTAIETFGCVCTIIILMTLSICTGLAQLPARPLYLLEAIALMVWWSFAIAMIVAAGSYKNEVFGRQVHVFTYFCIPLSGAFWQLSLTPPLIRDVLQWFPMTLIFEEARYGQFQHSPDTYVDPGYVAASCACLTVFGLAVLRSRERNL